MNRIMVVTGIPGVGKDFLIDATKKRFIDSSVHFGDFGEMVFQFCKNKFSLQSKDMLRELSQEEITPYVKRCIKHIRSREPAVISSHLVTIQQDTYRVNYETEKILRPKTYVFVTSSPESILSRRKTDKCRDRKIQNIEEIRFYNDLVESVTSAYADCFGSRLVRLENLEDNVERNTETLYREILKI